MLQFVLNLFRPDPRRTQVATLYKQIADAARQPALTPSSAFPTPWRAASRRSPYT
jgi:hypothetical protein